LKACGVWMRNFQTESGTVMKYRHALTKLSMFVKQQGYPKLKGRAAEIRHLGPTMAALCDQHMNPGVLIHRHIKKLLELNNKMHDILEKYSPAEGFFAVPEKPAARLTEVAFSMTQLHVMVSEHFEKEEVQIFNVTSKSHMNLHPIMLSRYVHPYLLWCFKGEDNMQKMSRVLASCLKGNSQTQGLVQAAEKYRLGLHLSFERLAKEKTSIT